MKIRAILIIVAALWALVIVGSAQAETLGTAFTYQGRLTDGGRPANGTHEFEFYLYDAPTAGNWLGVKTVEEVPVIDGIFTVQLDFGLAAFNGERRWLEIWVRNDSDGMPGETLAPRQEITPAPYALMAAKVPANSITTMELASGAVTAGKLASGAVTSGKIAAGAITGADIGIGAITSANISSGAIQSQNLAAGSVGASQLASGAVSGDKLGAGAALQNLLQNGQSPVGGSGVIMSQLAAAPELLAGGYQVIGQATLVPEAWAIKALAPDSPPAFNLSHQGNAAVWTGTEMLVWGGFSNAGGRYNPTTRTWTGMSTVNAPSARSNPTAVWTGTEMIVWGGLGGSGSVNTGGRYNPATDTWTPLNTSGAPSARQFHTAVWTGSRMVIWGGTTAAATSVADGALYNPATNTWTPVSTAGVAPLARRRHFAFWSPATSKMYVAAGLDFVERVDIYDPSTNSWSSKNTGISGLGLHGVVAAVWTGAEVLMVEDNSLGSSVVRLDIVSGNMTRVTAFGFEFGDGCSIIWDGSRAVIWEQSAALFNPATGTFSAISKTLAPPNNYRHVAVWTGSRMIVWGGLPGLSGGSYHPQADTWEPIPGLSEGGRRTGGFSQVWTGSDMLIWGGIDGGGSTVQGGRRYNLATNTWSIMSNTNAPSARVDHSAIWSGTEMIVWGGATADGEDYFHDGARYNPATDTWVALPVPGSPGVESHRAVWTGSEMIVIGPGGAGMQGARYNPSTNAWTPLPLANAPSVRRGFALVWTGQEAILWGGVNGIVGNASGARYNPSTNTWTPMTVNNAPPGRANPAVAWTGSELVVFGGGSESGPHPTVNGRYNPSANTWTTISSVNAPSARRDMDYAWDGTRLIVRGGMTVASVYIFGGSQYSPADDRWIPITDQSAPSARSGAKAVWTGTSMLIFGGENSSGALAATHTYVPQRNFYFYVRP
jgi:N-acetylneuraminic acid mutarotase